MEDRTSYHFICYKNKTEQNTFRHIFWCTEFYDWLILRSRALFDKQVVTHPLKKFHAGPCTKNVHFIIPIYVQIFQAGSFLEVFRPDFCVHFLLSRNVLYPPSIPFSFIFSL
jgi:hypothetical protein